MYCAEMMFLSGYSSLSQERACGWVLGRACCSNAHSVLYLVTAVGEGAPRAWQALRPAAAAQMRKSWPAIGLGRAAVATPEWS